MDHQFRARLLAGEVLVGSLVTLPAPEVAEILAGLSFDWLFIDAEHAPIGIHDAQMLLQAAGPGCPCLVRVPAGEEVWIKAALDIGAAGVIVPQVHTPQQAEQVVRLCKYPPQGARGVGVARAQGYGGRLTEYLATANEEVAVVVQAESAEAVRNIRSIAQVPGIDAVLIGPYDLSSSLGKVGQLDDPEVTEAITAVTEACLDAGVRLGIFGANAAAVRPFIQRGFTLIAVGIDTLFLAQAAGDVLSGLAQVSTAARNP
jgi:2-dehydro-3-deoxyglucarate aldolase/4-hydroxy-2-oxoheptanedioate aldolase